ncbi:hypothetical protein [Nocardioides humi]|uniref:Uncharacterized protein n=1 Tax=Nocardioides humi TaxID=449461 RepID=A0ABN2BDA8_9ACTN|nr:hypothetical protein [Nocardioides humi]
MAEEWRRYDAPQGAPYDGATYPAYDAGTERRRVRRRIGVLVAGAVVVLGGAGAGITALVMSAMGGDDDHTSTTTSHTLIQIGGSGDADLFTTDGTAAMAAALRAETGSTDVHEVVLYQGNAVLMVPGEDDAEVLLWDGEAMTSGGTVRSPRKPFDLTDLDGAVLAALCGTEPQSCTVVAGRPLPGSGGAWLTVAARDGVHLTDLAGKAV